MVLHGKDYYVAPAYPMLFSAGAVVCEEWIERTQRVWLKPLFALVLLVPVLVFMPLIAPVVSPERLVAFMRCDSLYAPSQRAQPRAVTSAAMLFGRAGLGGDGRRDGWHL